MSTEVTIDQMNGAIGVFMGYKMYDKRHPRNHGIGAPEAEPEKCMIIQKAKYHTSWDWLMPTFHKVREKAVEIKDDGTLQRLYSKVMEQLLFGTIADVHLAIYNYLTWYNQQKQTNEQ